MYISKVELVNVRCFEKVSIDLGTDGSSLLIAGNNGSGKSAILRSIAMGVCDEASAGGLLRELPGDFIRNSQNDATINIHFSEEKGKKWIIQTKLDLYERLNFERVHQKYFLGEIPEDKDDKGEDWMDFPWEDLFIVGYGAGLRTDGTEDYDQYFSGDAVYTLFKYSQTLQNPELSWRRISSTGDASQEKKVNKNISDLLKEVLELRDNYRVELGSNSIYVTDGEHDIEIGAAGDGYRAITTVVLDLLSWFFMMQNKDKGKKDWEELRLEEIKGIVIIDEIEKHLHPTLQRKIVGHLQKVFSGVQFIISTHSPLCVSGAADIESREWRVVTSFAGRKKHEVIPKDVPAGLRADQILVDYFDLNTTLSEKVEGIIREYQEIFSKDNKSLGDKKRLSELGSQLEDYNYNLAESVQDMEMQKKLFSLLEEEKDKHD